MAMANKLWQKQSGMNSHVAWRQTCAALTPGCAVVSLNEHDQEDGVPAGPAQEGTPDHKGVEPAAVIA